MDIESKLLQAKAELELKKICASKNLDGIFSIFADKKFIKRIYKNQIFIFEEFETLTWDDFVLVSVEGAGNYIKNLGREFFRIKYQGNDIVIEYFELKSENLLSSNFDANMEDWNNSVSIIFNDLNLLDIKYEIRLGKKNSFKSIKFSNKESNVFLKDTFGKLFIKALEFSNINSGLAKDIIKLYYENEFFNNNFQFKHKIDEKDFEKFESLFDFLSIKYNILNENKLKKLPISIMEEFFKDEFLRFEENNFILDFIIKNKDDFLSERMNVGILENPKGIIETYFFASGIYDKFYSSKIKEYDILDEQARKEREKNEKENKLIVIYFPRRRKGTNKYVREFLMETFYLGKDLNIRNIVKQIENCNSFKELEKLHDSLE